MKTRLIASMILMFSVGSYCQPAENDLQKQLEELKTRIKCLEKENDAIKSEGRTDDSLIYCGVRTEIFEAFTNISQLDFDFKSTSSKIAVTGLFTKLIQASNPTSDILGFKFTEIIYATVEKYFTASLKDERDKKRFGQVICKIVDNPIVSSLASTNPVTSVVSAIISTIASFSTSKVQVEKDGIKVKDVSVEQQDAFDNRSINAFKKELQVYIDFYDALIVTSNEFLEGLEYLDHKYAYLIQSVKSFKAELYADLGVNESNMLIRLSNLLPDPSVKHTDYGSLTRDERIRKCINLVGKYPALDQSVSEFKKEYNTLLTKFLTDYIRILESAKNFPDKDIDKTKTGQLIKDIEYFLDNQINKDDSAKPLPQPIK